MKIIKDTLKILTREERKIFSKLMVLMIIGAFLEMAGVGLILPALALMSNMDSVSDNSTVQSALNFLGNPNETQLMLLGVGLFIGIYLIKMSYLIFLSWYQTGFINRARASISLRIFSIYMHNDWAFHTKKNSAKLINTLTNETSMFASSHLTSLLNLISEIMVLIFICCLLFYVEPVSSSMLFTFLVLAILVFYLSIRKRTHRWGVERQINEGMRIKSLQQGLSGAKEIKLLGRENEFVKIYSIYNNKVANVVRLQGFFVTLPRLFIEFLTIFVFASVIVILSFQERSSFEIISVIGVFGAAALRLMPSVNRLIASQQAIRYSSTVISKLNEEIAHLKDFHAEVPNTKKFAFNKSLSLQSVEFSYDQAKKVINDLSIDIPIGSSIGIIGESGSGKSTLMDMMMGLLNPSKGQILVDGVDIFSNIRGWQKKIGYVPQTIYLIDDSLRRNVAFGIPETDIDDDKVNNALAKAQLEDFVDSLDDGLDTIFGERGVRLSGGQRQRIGIARALYHNPSILFLDEASSALDTDTETEVMKAVDSMMGEKTIVIIAHRLSTIKNCDLIYDISKGAYIEKNSIKFD